MNFDMDIDDRDTETFSSRDAGSSSSRNLPPDSMDIENLISDLRQDTRATHRDHNDAHSTASKKKDIESLRRIWVAERVSPEILPFDEALLDRIMTRVRHQMQYIEETSMKLKLGNDIQLKVLLVETELERVKFLLRGYLRTRLSKIDKYTLFLINNPEEVSKLSEDEVKYMNAHNEIITKLFRNQFLSRLPRNLQGMDDNMRGVSMIEKPDLDRAVFVRVVSDELETTIRAGQDLITLEYKGIYALRYSSISKYIQNGTVELV